jgi:hypothetical protein
MEQLMPSPDKALEVMAALEKIDGPMGKSKKFVAFMLIQVTWTAIIIYSIYEGLSDSVLMAQVGAASAAQNMFLGAQAWHDKHVKGAKAEALNGSVTKALDIISEDEEAE